LIEEGVFSMAAVRSVSRMSGGARDSLTEHPGLDEFVVDLDEFVDQVKSGPCLWVRPLPAIEPAERPYRSCLRVWGREDKL
jgi:hypothetical protein